MITIIDLDTGNLQSVANAFGRVGAEVRIARAPAECADSHVLVLPGVGAFERAMLRLHAQRFAPLLHAHVKGGRPLVGICLGMQLLGDLSHEHGRFEGLGLIRGDVVKLEPRAPGERVPNIGWMRADAAKPSVMFPRGVDGETFYHVHSYHLACGDPGDVAATIEFGGSRIVTAVERGNVFGMQFHPEKSQDPGLRLLESLLAHMNASATVTSR